MLDSDLAILYQVETKTFNQAVKRNIERFPENFRFQLKKEEYDSLRSQFVTSKEGRGGRRYLPYVFTEQGIAMLSAVLRSDIAIQVSIRIMETFVEMRKYMANRLICTAEKALSYGEVQVLATGENGKSLPIHISNLVKGTNKAEVKNGKIILHDVSPSEKVVVDFQVSGRQNYAMGVEVSGNQE